MRSVSGMMAASMIAILAVGCASVKEDWAAARNRDSVPAYERFVSQHPGSQFEADAQQRISRLKEKQVKQQQAQREYEEAQLAHQRAIEEIDKLAADASPESVDKLVRMLEKEVSKVESRPEFTTGVSGGAIALWALTPDGETRQSLAQALGKTHNRSAVPVLIRCLRDPERSIQTFRVNYRSGAVGGGETYIYLIRVAAAQALKDVTGQDFEQDIDKWQGWWQQNKD